MTKIVDAPAERCARTVDMFAAPAPAKRRARPVEAAGDPAKGFWTYDDLAAVFGVSADRCKRKMAAWEDDGFPAPLPWSLREKRWNPAAVLAWKRRCETAISATPVELVGHQGGKR